MIKQVVILLGIIVSFVIAQERKISLKDGKISGQSYEGEAVKPYFFNPKIQVSDNLNFRISRVQKLHPTDNEVERIKKIKTDLKRKNNFIETEKSSKTLASPPTKGREFMGNTFNGYYPNDNTIAISNSGYIVSAINSQIKFYDQNGNLLNSYSLSDFANNSQLTASHYDPVCLYDPGENRFIMVHLHGTTPSESRVIVSFSKSGNPTDGFWVYTLNGNVGNRGNWFDYPKIGISLNDVFITGNLFDSNDNFSEPVILQIPKSAGYSGSTLNYIYWLNIKDGDGNTPFTLLPLSGGYSNYGPGIYLVSSKSAGSSKVFLYDITDDYGQNPNLLSYSVNTNSYSVGGTVPQKNTGDVLDNGDCRCLSGFYANGVCHFVFTSEYQNGYNGLNYNRLNVSNKTNTSTTFGLNGYDYCYPSVAPLGTNSSDKTVCIGFLRSSASIFPECRAVVVDHNMNWSSSILVKAGEDYVDIASGSTERWGDYTGICKKFNASTPTVWFAGSYGRSSFSNSNVNGTWIAELISSSSSPVEDGLNKNNKILVYPNPVQNYFHLNFTLKETDTYEIKIIDTQGKVVKDLFKGTLKPGEHRLTFNLQALAPGMYFVKIFNQQITLANEKILVTD